MIKIKYFIYATITILLYSCDSVKTKHYDSGEVESISFFRFMAKTPYQKEEYSKKGMLLRKLYLDPSGIAISSTEYKVNGDSCVSYYSRGGKDSYNIVYTSEGEVIHNPIKNNKLMGVSRYYKDSELKRRVFYLSDSIVAMESYENIKIGKSILVNEIRGNNVYEKEIINKDFNYFVSQHIKNREHRLFQYGVYFLHENNTIDTTYGDFVILDVPDTIKVGERVKGRVLWNHWKKKDLHFELNLNEINKNPLDSLPILSLKESKGCVRFSLKPEVTELGYHYLTGNVVLRKKDSSVYQRYFIYDDFHVIP